MADAPIVDLVDAPDEDIPVRVMCPECLGAKIVFEGGDWRPCGACEATGRRAPVGRDHIGG